MYVDLSLQTNNKIQLNHILKRIREQKYYSHLAFDYEFKDTQIKLSNELIKTQKGEHQIQTYLRATLIIEQSASLHQLGTPNNQFDLIALKPLNEKIFSTICTQHDNYDILTFDFGNKLPFMLKRNPVYQCIRRGKYFQIQYDSMFDQNKRTVCMTNMINLIKATNGKNIIVSSHSSQYYQHKTPYDVISLLVTLGMNKQQAFQSIKLNPLNLIKSSIHRKFFKGIIKQIQPIKVQKIGKKIKKHKQKLQKKIQS